MHGSNVDESKQVPGTHLSPSSKALETYFLVATVW